MVYDIREVEQKENRVLGTLGHKQLILWLGDRRQDGAIIQLEDHFAKRLVGFGVAGWRVIAVGVAAARLEAVNEKGRGLGHVVDIAWGSVAALATDTAGGWLWLNCSFSEMDRAGTNRTWDVKKYANDETWDHEAGEWIITKEDLGGRK